MLVIHFNFICVKIIDFIDAYIKRVTPLLEYSWDLIDFTCSTGSELVFPACVVNGTGVSKTFQILYRNEEVALDDTIMFRAHILVDSHKV